MADPVIRLKRSAVAGKRPTLANVELGEVALNTYDGNLFTRQDTGGVGIGTTVTLLTPWQESYGAASISYTGDVNVTGVITASDGRLIAGVGISSEGTYIGSGVTAFNFIGGGVSSVTLPSAGFSTVKIDFNGLTGIFAKTENKFSATEGQTSFSVGYEVGYVDVFLNGVRLNSDNFAATDGSTVGLTTAASAGDAVDIIVYEPQSSATPKRVVTNATATSGQTVFTVPSYDTGTNSMDVFLNGIKLDSAEFTETDGTTVTLAVGAALNDELQFISYESDNNFWSLNGSTLHRTSPSNPVAIGTDTQNGDSYLTVGQPGAGGTALYSHAGVTVPSGKILNGTVTARSVGTGNFKLQVEGTGSDSGITVTRNANSVAGPNIRLYKSRGTSVGSTEPMQSDDAFGYIGFWGADGSSVGAEGARIYAELDQASPGIGTLPGRLRFETTPIDGTGAVERMRITSDGYVRLSSDTNGIQFNGNTAADDTLDDYEEGTWTPVYGGSSSNPTVTYGVNTGYYTKIGNTVIAQFVIYTNSVSGGSGTLRLAGFPFNFPSSSNQATTSVWVAKWGVTYPNAFRSLSNVDYGTFYLENSTTQIQVSNLTVTANKNQIEACIVYTIT